MAQLNSDELLDVARKAHEALSEAKTKEEVAAVFDAFRSLGYKVVARMLLGSSPEDATARWRSKIDVS